MSFYMTKKARSKSPCIFGLILQYRVHPVSQNSALNFQIFFFSELIYSLLETNVENVYNL